MNINKMIAIVTYQKNRRIETVQVECKKDDDDRTIVAKAKKAILMASGYSLPLGFYGWQVVRRK